MTRTDVRSVLGVTLVVLFVGVGAAGVEDGDAADAFERLETRLLGEPVVRLGFEIRATGAVTADLRGELMLSGTSTADLTASGEFAGEQVSLELHAADGRMRGGRGGAAFDLETPPALREALVIGLTRMGLLHNLAMLSGDAPPDGGDGGVRDWVVVDGVWAADGGPDGSTMGLAFAIHVAGKHAADATLWLGGDGLPVLRRQTVRFPSGEMEVEERYLRVEVDG